MINNLVVFTFLSQTKNENMKSFHNYTKQHFSCIAQGIQGYSLETEISSMMAQR